MLRLAIPSSWSEPSTCTSNRSVANSTTPASTSRRCGASAIAFAKIVRPRAYRNKLEPQPLGDDIPLDFRGPRIKRAADRVAQLALEFELGHVPGAAVDLDRVETRLDERLGDVELGHGRIHVGRFALLHEPADLVVEQPGRFVAELHVYNSVGHRLQLADCLAELLARLSVLNTPFQLPAHDAQAGG